MNSSVWIASVKTHKVVFKTTLTFENKIYLHLTFTHAIGSKSCIHIKRWLLQKIGNKINSIVLNTLEKPGLDLHGAASCTQILKQSNNKLTAVVQEQ